MIQLMDIIGKVIKAVNMHESAVTFNLGNWATGIYLINYTDVAHKQVIKINKQ